MSYISEVAVRLKESGRARDWALTKIGIETDMTGERWSALCPLPEHNDSNPSFFIDSEGRWRCMRCDEFGDAIDLVARYTGADLVATAHLAAMENDLRGLLALPSRKANVEIRVPAVLEDAKQMAAYKAMTHSLSNRRRYGGQRSDFDGVEGEHWFSVKSVSQMASLVGEEIDESDLWWRRRGTSKPNAQYDFITGRTNDSVQSNFRRWLSLNEAAPARELLRKKGITEEVAEQWGVGYCPRASQDVLLRLTQDASPRAIRDVGLISKARLGINQAGRITVPIRNVAGQIVGFAGRTMQDNRIKWLSTSGLDRTILYGIDKAWPFIRECGQVIVVEGYWDVVMMHAMGWRNTVATMGTSLKKEQAIKLSNMGDAIFMMDGDEAGRKAAIKAQFTMAKHGALPWVAQLPAGKDPADASLKSIAKALASPKRLHRIRGPEAARFLKQVTDPLAKRLIQKGMEMEGIVEPVEDPVSWPAVGGLRLKSA